MYAMQDGQTRSARLRSGTLGDDGAARLRAARAYAGITRARLVEIMADQRVTARSLAKWESGDAGPPPELIDLLANACGVPKSFLRGALGNGGDPFEHDALRELGSELRDLRDRLGTLERALSHLLD